MKKVRALKVGFFFLLIVSTVFISEVSAEKKVFFTFSTPPTSSALYPYCVGVATALSPVYPEFHITVSENQGAVQITKLVRSGGALLGNSVSSTDYENYAGIGSFDNSPGKKSRILWYYEKTPLQLVVAKDSGIKTVADLEGKKFNPGGTTTSAEALTYNIMKVLNVKPNYFTANQADAGDAYSSRQIYGTVKAGPANDSFVLQLNASRPINIISFSDSELNKIINDMPYVVRYKIPANTYACIGYDINTIMTLMGIQTTTAMTQEMGYKMIKAMCEGGKKIWQASYPLGANNDILALTLESSVPLQAGTVQYLVEKGYTVPAKLIPPEYKPAGK